MAVIKDGLFARLFYCFKTIDTLNTARVEHEY